MPFKGMDNRSTMPFKNCNRPENRRGSDVSPIRGPRQINDVVADGCGPIFEQLRGLDKAVPQVVSSETCFKPLSQFGPIEVTPDEDEAIVARFTTPQAVGATVEEHVNTLEDESLWLTLDAQNTFHAEDVDTFCQKQIANPIVQTVGVEIAGGL